MKQVAELEAASPVQPTGPCSESLVLTEVLTVTCKSHCWHSEPEKSESLSHSYYSFYYPVLFCPELSTEQFELLV